MLSKKGKKPKLCMFCGRDELFGPMNREHFVPRGLWAGPRPQGTKTCPAHVTCNQKFAEDNDYFRLVIASDEDSLPHNEAERVLNGPVKKMTVESPGRYLRHAKDFAVRARYSRGGVYLGDQACFPIDFPRIERVVQNIAKGLFYVRVGKPLGQDRHILVIRDEDTKTDLVDFLQSRMGHWYDFGDMVFTWCDVFAEGLEDMACIMQFYRRKIFFVVTSKGNGQVDRTSAEQRA